MQCRIPKLRVEYAQISFFNILYPYNFFLRYPYPYNFFLQISRIPATLNGASQGHICSFRQTFRIDKTKTRQDKTNRQLAQKTNARKKLYKSQKPTNALSFNLETSVASSVSFNSRSLRQAVKIKAQLTFAEYLKRNSIVMFSWQ